MSGDENDGHRILEDLSRAVELWVRQGSGGLLTRWLSRELDSEGGPSA